MSKEIIYIGDPMCSWCWGFAPELEKMRNQFNDRSPLTIVVGGLHAYDTEPMSDQYKATIRHHWEDVNKATGATFDYRFFDRQGFVLDTEPACRAVVTMRTLKADVLFPFYDSISRSFYSENKDTTEVETFRALAREVGVEADEFADLFSSQAMKYETRNDFTLARKLGANGFPTVVVKENDDYGLLMTGYCPFETLKPALEKWLNGTP